MSFKNLLIATIAIVLTTISLMAILALTNKPTSFSSGDSIQITDGENDEVEEEDILIGGDRDEHGCLGSAGYSWSENVGACIRGWELNDSQKKAAGMAVDYYGSKNGLTVIKADAARCPGCFRVELQDEPDRVTITITNWEVTGQSLTSEECEEMGGRVTNTVGGNSCDIGEKDVGEVTGFISPNICCLDEE